MPDGNLLLTLRQINICLGLYESEKLAASEMTFAQAFLLNEIFSMDRECSHTPGKRPAPAPAGPCPFSLVGIIPNPYAERR